MVRVLILDDHELVRIGLRRLIEEHDDLVLVGEASSAAEALGLLATVRADVAVLDVRLPDAGGVEVCREVRSRHPEVQCLMLTAAADESTLFGAIMAGAAGYVLKQSAGTTLIDAIRSVARGESQLDPSVTRPILDRLRSGSQDDELLHRLTPQERRILNMIAEGRTNREIAERMYLAEKTVKNYVSSMLTKLGMQRRSQAAAYAARLGDRILPGQ
ncbi:MAG TPA: response regulator transcription factor [Acidimicrobiia bacterium]|nr:response regulator transcription factor [Acidimicrobiia bacterium]